MKNLHDFEREAFAVKQELAAVIFKRFGEGNSERRNSDTFKIATLAVAEMAGDMFFTVCSSEEDARTLTRIFSDLVIARCRTLASSQTKEELA